MKTDKLKRLMKAAAENGLVVPAFNVAYLPMVKPISETLAELRVLGMAEVARPDYEKFGAVSIKAVAEEYRRSADPRFVTLHMDHVPVIDEDKLPVDWEPIIAEAISRGFDSVMLDGSRLSFAENIAAVAKAARLAHEQGVLVEAELGAVMGHESGPMPPYDEIFKQKMGFTKPEQAAEFVRKTGVDWLSVSCGSIHGAISGAAKDRKKPEAKIDIEHLKKLRLAAGVPLVLHGGSGVQKTYVLEAVKNGIAKINIGTEIRQAYEQNLGPDGKNIEAARTAVSRSIRELVNDVYRIAGSAEKLYRLTGEKL